MTELDSHNRKPSSSSSVGTRPFGFIARYFGSLFMPNGPPISMRVCSSPSSPTAHIAFCTLDDVLRPHILIIAASFLHSLWRGEPSLGIADGADHLAPGYDLALEVGRCFRQRLDRHVETDRLE